MPVDAPMIHTRAADQAGVSHFVFSSSVAVYGTPERVPIPESHPLRPTSPYGENKAEAVLYGVVLWGLMFASVAAITFSGTRLAVGTFLGTANVASNVSNADWYAR